MKGRWPLTATALFLLMAACAPQPLTSSRWLRMNGREKELYVRTLLGHEEVLTRKGGKGHRYTAAPSAYVRRIDERFAAGDRRTVEQIWDDLADGALSPALPHGPAAAKPPRPRAGAAEIATPPVTLSGIECDTGSHLAKGVHL
jgi:hypothetical protein